MFRPLDCSPSQSCHRLSRSFNARITRWLELLPSSICAEVVLRLGKCDRGLLDAASMDDVDIDTNTSTDQCIIAGPGIVPRVFAIFVGCGILSSICARWFHHCGNCCGLLSVSGAVCLHPTRSAGRSGRSFPRRPTLETANFTVCDGVHSVWDSPGFGRASASILASDHFLGCGWRSLLFVVKQWLTRFRRERVESIGNCRGRLLERRGGTGRS